MITATIKRCQDVALAMGWNYPFFLVPLSYVTWQETKEVETMAISVSGVIKVNPEYIQTLADVELAWVVFHELYHPMLAHHERMGSRDPKRWGRAADRALNQAIRDMGGRLPKGALYPRNGQEAMTAEEIYDHEPSQPEDEDGGQAAACQGCQAKDDTGEGGNQPGEQQGQNGQDGEGPGHGQPQMSSAQASRQWAECAAQAKQLAAGTGHADILNRILNMPRPRVRWEQLLKSVASHALAAHGRDDQTWSKRNRRAQPDTYLPGWTATRATVGVVIDSSGSVGDEELDKLISETKKIASLSGVRVYLVLHASTCYFSDWVNVKSGDSVSERITDRGGTDFNEAYQRLSDAKRRLDVVVHCTDGEIWGDWPTPPGNVRRLVVAQVGNSKIKPPSGTQVVPVEV